MKNICFFNSINFWGGGEKLHLESAVEFKKKGYTVFMVANPKAPLWEKAKAEGLIMCPAVVGNLSFLNPFKIKRLARFYRENDIDTVIFSSSQDLKLGSISGKAGGVKNIVYLRGLAVPIKASIVNRYVFSSLLTHIVPNSQETERNILKHLHKYIDKSKVRTIYHGIDVDSLSASFDYRLKEIEEQGHGVILGNAGRLTSQKGQVDLIKIAKILKDQGVDFTLFIAGTGEMYDKLAVMIEEYNLQKEVVLLGFVKDMECFMSSIDIFVLSSIWEGFGFVLVEAMIKSKPVVAFDITSNPEVVQADVTGFLADYPDLDMFAEKTRLLIDDENLRHKMGKAGKDSVYKRFQLVDRITELEEYLLEGG